MSLDTRNPRRLPAHHRRELEISRADLELRIFEERGFAFVQSALAIPNEAGASFRADNNTAHQANATFQAGASAPGTTYADLYWWDTTNQVLKKRNQANSAWILASIFGTRDEAFVVSRSTNTILGLSDIGKTFVATSTFTQTLTAAATLGDGWYCFYRNDGTGVITIDPNASETIDGTTVAILFSGDSCRIACNGTGFSTVGLATVRKIFTNTTAVGNVGAAGPDDLMSYTLPANALSVNGRGIRITGRGKTANNANAKNLGYPSGNAQNLTINQVGFWWAQIEIIRTGANAQKYTAYFSETGPNIGTPKVSQLSGTLADTDTAGIVYKFVVNTSTADNDVTQEMMMVEYLTGG